MYILYISKCLQRLPGSCLLSKQNFTADWQAARYHKSHRPAQLLEDGEYSFQDTDDGDGDDVADVSIGEDVVQNCADGDGADAVGVKYCCSVYSKGNESNVDTKQVFG